MRRLAMVLGVLMLNAAGASAAERRLGAIDVRPSAGLALAGDGVVALERGALRVYTPGARARTLATRVPPLSKPIASRSHVVLMTGGDPDGPVMAGPLSGPLAPIAACAKDATTADLDGSVLVMATMGCAGRRDGVLYEQDLARPDLPPRALPIGNVWEVALAGSYVLAGDDESLRLIDRPSGRVIRNAAVTEFEGFDVQADGRFAWCDGRTLRVAGPDPAVPARRAGMRCTGEVVMAGGRVAATALGDAHMTLVPFARASAVPQLGELAPGSTFDWNGSRVAYARLDCHDGPGVYLAAPGDRPVRASDRRCRPVAGALRRPRASRTARIRIRCPYGCRASVGLRIGRTAPAASRRIALRRGRSRTLTFRLPTAALRLLARRGPVPARLSFRFDRGDGDRAFFAVQRRLRR